MVDIHCHILPGVDDGAKSPEIAVEMCRIAHADGITHMVATPHANDRYAYDRAAHQERLEHLHRTIGGIIELSLGCDFHMSYDNVEQALHEPAPFTIGNSSYLLVELSDFAVSAHTGVTLEQLVKRGLTPIVTHPERNMILQRRPDLLIPWIEAGCLVQLTASTFTGRWGQGALRAAQWLLKHDAVHVVASDAHDMRHRPPILSQARKILTGWLGQEIADALVSANPDAIVHGRPVPYLPQPIR